MMLNILSQGSFEEETALPKGLENWNKELPSESGGGNEEKNQGDRKEDDEKDDKKKEDTSDKPSKDEKS